MLYFREFGRVRDVRKAKGLPCGDVQRHAFHKQALGYNKSSKDFTNAELTKVLAVFKAITEPGNLLAQLKALGHTEFQRAEAWRHVLAICVELKIGDKWAYDKDDLLNRRVAYVDGIVAKVIKSKVRWDQLDDKEANVILGIMRRRLFAVQKQRAKHATPAAADESVPF